MGVSNIETRPSLSKDSAAELSALDDTPFKSGEIAYLTDQDKFFYLKRNSAVTPSSTVLVTKSGVGRWILGPCMCEEEG